MGSREEEEGVDVAILDVGVVGFVLAWSGEALLVVVVDVDMGMEVGVSVGMSVCVGVCECVLVL